MLGRSQVQIADQLNIGPILVHDEELQVLSVARKRPRRTITVAIAGEHDLSTGHRARAQVEYALGKVCLSFFRRAKVLGPVGSSCIGCKLLMRQLDYFPSL